MERKEILIALGALLEKEPDRIACMANAAAFLYHALDDINWLGFYRFKRGELVLGPFIGRPACVRIAPGKGVCGTAFEKRCILRVPNVLDFPGHTACDATSRSEIVLPLFDKEKTPVGVLDVDSPRLDRFSEEDERFLTAAADIIAAALMAGEDA